MWERNVTTQCFSEKFEMLSNTEMRQMQEKGMKRERLFYIHLTELPFAFTKIIIFKFFMAQIQYSSEISVLIVMRSLHDAVTPKWEKVRALTGDSHWKGVLSASRQNT